jgi:hypothetical protein
LRKFNSSMANTIKDELIDFQTIDRTETQKANNNRKLSALSTVDFVRFGHSPSLPFLSRFLLILAKIARYLLPLGNLGIYPVEFLHLSLGLDIPSVFPAPPFHRVGILPSANVTIFAARLKKNFYNPLERPQRTWMSAVYPMKICIDLSRF